MALLLISRQQDSCNLVPSHTSTELQPPYPCRCPLCADQTFYLHLDGVAVASQSIVCSKEQLL